MPVVAVLGVAFLRDFDDKTLVQSSGIVTLFQMFWKRFDVDVCDIICCDVGWLFWLREV